VTSVYLQGVGGKAGSQLSCRQSILVCTCNPPPSVTNLTLSYPTLWFTHHGAITQQTLNITGHLMKSADRIMRSCHQVCVPGNETTRHEGKGAGMVCSHSNYTFRDIRYWHWCCWRLKSTGYVTLFRLVKYLPTFRLTDP